MKLLLLLTLLLAEPAATPAPASPIPPGVDPDFDARVADPAYRKNGPRVVIDEAHHNVHTASGGYKPFADLIAADGYRIESNRAPFTPETLKDWDVLVIANPRGASPDAPLADRGKAAFTDAEADAVRDWVKAGGSLLLIADHFPIGSAARILAGRFGVDMSNGWTEDPRLKEGVGALAFQRKDGSLADHPITRGRRRSERIERVGTFLGQSLAGPPGSVPLLRLSSEARDLLPPEKQEAVSAAGRSQGLALTSGRGRVVVLGEAAMLTAQRVKHVQFGLSAPGFDNRQLALNILHWLTRKL